MSVYADMQAFGVRVNARYAVPLHGQEARRRDSQQ
jgi:hypothetical protein